MKRIIDLFLVFCIFISISTLTGCTDYLPGNSDRIKSPSNTSIYMKGTWNITEKVEGDSSTVEGEGQLEGRKFSISGYTISYGNHKWEDVSYKMKKVKAEDYFLHKFADASKETNLTGHEIIVISASEGDNFLYEFVVLDEDNLLVSIEDEFYYLARISDDVEYVDEGTIITNTGDAEATGTMEEAAPKSGLLMSIRTPAGIVQANGTTPGNEEADGNKAADGNEDNTYEESIYNTYWISMINGTPENVLTAPGIYVPRKDGFWKLEIEKIMGEKGLEDELTAIHATSKVELKKAKITPDIADDTERPQEKLAAVETSIRKRILYVGNDYVCIETGETTTKESNKSLYIKKTLSTLPIYNTSNSSGLKLSDLAGDNGILAMDGGITGILNSNGVSSSNIAGAGRQETNFALFRKTGHWFFKGRINFSDNTPLPYLDYNINLIPPSDMVAYDVLQIPWNVIKEELPQAVDAYTSPNRDMAILLTGNMAAVYAINGSRLSEEPLQKFSLPEGSTVIMAEWATGDYTEKWQSSFVKNNITTEADISVE